MKLTLPTGRAGQALALAIPLFFLAVVWFGAVAPLLELYAERAQALALRTTALAHMRAAVLNLPALRAEAAQRPREAEPASALLTDESDAVAAAHLQSLIEQLATQSGATVASIESMAPETKGSLHRIGLSIRASGPYPAIVRLLGRIVEASPQMQVDDLQLHQTPAIVVLRSAPLDTSFTLYAFRSGGGAG